jgi:hypothetical protein
VAVVAIVALREPTGHGATALSAKATVATTAKRSPTPTRRASSSSSSSKATDSHSGSAVKNVPLIVLNNTTTLGLAHQAAQRFEHGGWTVTHYDNLRNEILSTCAYYDPNVAGAKAAATALQAQYPTIKRVEPKFVGLPSGPVVVVLTPDYSAG